MALTNQGQRALVAANTAIGKDNERRIFEALVEYGDLTLPELGRLVELSDGSVWGRIQKLVSEGRVIDTGEKRRAGKRGREAIIYAAVVDPDEIDRINERRERDRRAKIALAQPVKRDPFITAFFGEYKAALV